MTVDATAATYGQELADIYDTIYLRGRRKDYAAESATVVRIIRERSPQAASVLDVACGTGEHLAHLRQQFAHVEGLELSEPMRHVALAKLTGVAVHAGDMRDFDLGVRFDAVTCLSFSIGYLPDVEALPDAVAAMARHLNPGGVLIVEPWYTPDQWRDNEITYSVAEIDGQTIMRMGHSSSHGRTAVMHGHYLVGDGSGIRHFHDEHRFTLFTEEEYRAAFDAAGCSVERVAGHTPGREPLVGIRRR